MAYAIAGIDVHKRMLAVVVSDLRAAREDAFERCQFGSTPAGRSCGEGQGHGTSQSSR